jgi:hypothetical protein
LAVNGEPMKRAVDRFLIGTPFAVPTRTSALPGGCNLDPQSPISNLQSLIPDPCPPLFKKCA